ncbi:MAG: T9SS type A sorting domain-containing protein [Flavobacteriales bacterium]|nr:T9SS type A sorting domain-containing protein [Flavobacteriales bacterium]
MKKLLLSLTVAVVATFSAQAQSCVPNPQYADSTYGAWPDTTTNFPPATQNQFYSTDLNFKVPLDATLASASAPPNSTIQSFVVTSVDGLPTEYDYVCSNSNCTYNGGDNGCANVFGTTATAGTYNVTINISATVLVTIVPGLPPQSLTQPTSFTGYKIVVGVAGTIEQVIAPIVVSPNPANDEIKIEGISASMKASKVEITNIEGKVVASKEVENGTNYSFDLAGMKAGIYFVNVTHASGVETVKFIKN